MIKRAYCRIEELSAAAAVLVSMALVCGAAKQDVVINEIMYHPPYDLEALQYVELFNRGTSVVDLSHWQFTKGIRFTFPETTTLGPDGYLVICRDHAAFAEYYPLGVGVLGDFEGKLSHGGEKIVLCDRELNPVESVVYSDTAPWPTGPDGSSASLERICPFVSGDEPFNWAGSTLPAVEKPAGTPGRKNDNYSTGPLPRIFNVEFATPQPDQETIVTASVDDAMGVKAVALHYRMASTGRESPETVVLMQRVAGDAHAGSYRAAIAGQPSNTLVRFRLHAENAASAERFQPSANEPCPTYSIATFTNTNTARVPFAYMINVAPPQRESRIRLGTSRPISVAASPTVGNGAFIVLPPGEGKVEVFDHVQIRPRRGGFKVHFPKDHTFRGMTGINVIFEWSSRWVLSEPLAYEAVPHGGGAGASHGPLASLVRWSLARLPVDDRTAEQDLSHPKPARQ